MDMNQIMETLAQFATTYGLKVIGAILILIVGRVAAGLVRKGIAKALGRAQMDASLSRFFGNLAFVAVMTFAVLASLSKFGVETTSFVAVLGAAGFAVGFALQGSLGNFAAGVMLLVFRPFKTGDYIEAGGVAGTVKEVQLFNTVLDTPDNVRIIVPNGGIYGGVIKNYSHNATRRVDIPVGIAYDADIGRAIAAISDTLQKDGRVLAEPALQVLVTDLGDSSVNLAVRFWTQAGDYWPSKFDMVRAVKERLDAEGIEIPFPQRVVHLTKTAD